MAFSASLPLLAILVLATLAPQASAQLQPRISLSHGCTGFDQPCAIDLVEGLDQWVSLQLDEPIICNNQSIECSVIVNISNSHPNIIAVEPCYVRWHRDEWHHTKRVRITARQSYTHTGPQQIHLESNVVSQAEYYLSFDPQDLYIVAEERRTATCSSVGDPHYNSFDGKYYHFYDGRSRNPSRVTLYRSTTRDFVIQNQVRGYPAGNCGIAAREGRDRVVINNCGRSLQIITDFHSATEEHRPRIQVSGSTYTVYFHSGAYVRMAVTGWMNLYVGGVDYRQSCGICGDFDGNPNNDAPSYIVRSYTNLFPCQQVPSVVPGSRTYGDQWNWVYNAADFGTEDTTVPDSQQDCPYELQRIVRPVINTDDIEDITDALRDRTDAIRDQNNDTFTFDPATGNATVVQPYDINLATNDCETLINGSQTVAVCRQRYTDFNALVPNFVEDCAFDYSEMGGPNSAVAQDFFDGIIRVMEQNCLEITIQNGDAGVADLQNVLCDNACSGRGTCTGAQCNCNTGYAGEDCSIDLNAPPVVHIMSDLAYDTSGTQTGMSPREIQITGTNFLLSANLACRWGNSSTSEEYITNATYIGPLSIICPVPTFRYTGAASLVLPFSITNDRNNWSSGRFDFLFYDGICQSCNERGECGINNQTCTIGTGATAQCYLAGATESGNDANPCQVCQPTISNTRLAYSYAPRQCRPTYTTEIYQTEILGSASANDVIMSVDATANTLVTDDPDGYPIRYEYVPGADRDASVRQWFDVDQNGNIYILRAVDISDPQFMNMEHAAQDPTRFSGHFSIRATDRQNYSITVDVIIQLVPEGHRPIFPVGGFRGVIAENPTNGDQVTFTNGTNMVITADDPDDQADTSTIEYVWHMEPSEAAGALLIDRSTGAVTVGNGSKVDFETTPVLHYQVRASDNALLFYITDVYVNVTDVAEAPNAVLLNESTQVRIPENYVGTVGNLSTVDPEGGVFTYSLATNSNFQLMQYANGVYYINMTSPINFEDLGNNPQQELQVTSTDSTGLSITATVIVLITDVNENPLPAQLTQISNQVTLSGNDLTLSEATNLGTPLLSVAATDPEGGAVTCYVANTYFVIQNNQLLLRVSLDFETAPEITLTVLCEDPEGNQGLDTVISVQVTNVNEAPWVSGWINQQSSPVPEGQAPGTRTTIGQVTISDDANSATPVVTATNSTLFEVGPLQCGATDATTPIQCTAEVFLRSTAVVSYEDGTNGMYPVFLTLSDNAGQSGGALSVVVGPPSTTVSMRVADVAEGPTGLEMSTFSVVENPPNNSVIAVMTIIDEDTTGDDFTLTLTSNPGDAFAVVPNSTAAGSRRRQSTGGRVWLLVVNNPAQFDYETSQSISFTVDITDNRVPSTISVTENLDITDAPMAITNNVGTFTGVQGDSGIVFSLTNLDNPQLVTDLAWSIDSNWALLNKQPDGSAALVVDTTQDDNQGDSRTVQVTATFGQGASVGPVIQQFVLILVDVQNVPSLTEASYTSVINHFSGAPQGVVLANVEANGDSDDTMEFFVGRAVSGACPSGEVCVTAYHMPVGADRNRFAFAEQYATSNNLDSSSATTMVIESELFSSCPNVDITGNSFNCQLQVESAPQITPVVLASGSLSNPASPSSGLYIVAKLRPVPGRDPTTDMELGAISPITVTFLGQGNMPPAPDGATNTWSDDDNFYAETPDGTLLWNVDTGTWEPTIIFTLGNSGGPNDSSAGLASWIYVLIVLVLVLLILGFAVGYFYYQKNHNAADLFDGREKYADSMNPAWQTDDDPVPYEVTPFVPGVRSAMYDWYHPDMSRKDCTDHLMKRGEGAFVVRDSDANPGWFMLGVKSANMVIHDKIRQTENGEYQLMPSSGQAAGIAQPCFATLPDLIDYYLSEQPGMSYTLTASDPVYDNQRLHQERTGEVLQSTTSGPNVPQKEREYAEADYSFGAGASLEKHGGDSVGNPMYFASPVNNTPTYAATEGYLDVVADDNKPSAGYLDVQSDPSGHQSRGYLDVEPDGAKISGSVTGYSDVPSSA